MPAAAARRFENMASVSASSKKRPQHLQQERDSSTVWSRFQAFRDRTRLIQHPHKPFGRNHHKTPSSDEDDSEHSYSDTVMDSATAELYSFYTEHESTGSSSLAPEEKDHNNNGLPPSILKTSLKHKSNKRNGCSSSTPKWQPSSSSSSSKPQRSSRVRFSVVRTYHHESIMGDHPFPQQGPPLTLAWESLFQETFVLGEDDQSTLHNHCYSPIHTSGPTTTMSLEQQLERAQEQKARRRHRRKRRGEMAHSVRRWSAAERYAICQLPVNAKQVLRLEKVSAAIRASRDAESQAYFAAQAAREQRRRQKYERTLDLLLL